MGTFQYEAMNSSGQTVKGTVDASDSNEAINKIKQMGNFPTKVKERAGGGKSSGQKKSAGGGSGPRAPQRKGPRKAGKVSNKLLTQFTRQLSTLQDAGLPILRALRILEEQQKPGMLRVAIRLIADDVESGSSLSEAMARQDRTFDKLYINMVRAGELGGVLDLILQRLADFMEQSEALKRKVKGALIYPIAVMTIAGLIVTGLLVFVVPKFETIFSDMGTALPAPTQALLDLSKWMSAQYGWAWIIGTPITLLIVAKLLRQSEGGAYFMDKLRLSIPIVGKITGKSSISRFSRTLGTLLGAGVPILDALNITAETAGNEVYTRALRNVRDSIREGEAIAKPLRQARVVDSMVVNMIDVGEETGELDNMLERIADNYDEEVEVMVSGLVSLLEPVMVISLGVIVGGIVVALFMPMVSMLQTVQG
jgi:type IV pilus assembly protein PilC